MKYIHIIIFVTLIGILLFSSCKKDDRISPISSSIAEKQQNPSTAHNGSNNSLSSGNNTVSAKKGGGSWGVHRTLFDNLGGTSIFGCFPPAVNCFDEVPIYGIAPYLDELRDAITQNTVKDFFHNGKWLHVFPDLTGKPLADLMSGQTSLREIKGQGQSPDMVSFMAIWSDPLKPGTPNYGQ